MENKLENIKNKINNIKILLDEKITNNSVDDLKKFKGKVEDVFDYYLAKINKINFNLLQESVLDSISNNIDNCDISLRSFFIDSAGNVAYFTNAKSYFNNIMPLVNSIPDLNKETTKETLNQIIGRFKCSFERINNTLLNKINDFDNKVKVLNEEILSLKEENEKLANRIEEQNTNINNYLNSFNNTFLESQNTRNAEFIKTKDTINSQYKQLLNEQDDTFKNILCKIHDDYNNFISKKEKDFQILEDDINSKVNIIFNFLEKNKIKSEELLGIIGKNVYAGNYKAYADKSKNFSNWLFWISFGIMFFVAICLALPLFWQLIVMFKSEKVPGLDFWKSLAYRIPTLAVLLLPAFYLSIEAKKQREKEFKYRDFEIKISAITPYMNDIKEVNNDNICEKDRVKLELAKTFFGETYKENSNENIIIPKDVIALIDCLADKILKITKKG